MRKPWLLLGALLALVACAEDSSLPSASGKGTIQAINAVVGSPEIAFFIEERELGSVPYRAGSSAARYDDLEYSFNFNARFPGELQTRRIASVPLKVDVDRQYTMVPTGDLAAPDVFVWEGEERSFDENDTVSQLRFAHLAAPLGALDVYLEAPGTPPVAGNAIGTLAAIGEILPPVDVEAGNYVVTMTAAGDPANIVYQSITVPLTAQIAYTAPLFESDEQDVAPYNLRLISPGGASANVPDDRFPPTIRFIQTSADLPATDIYGDDLLTNQLVANHEFGDVTGDIPAASGDYSVFYTPAGNPGAVIFEDVFGLSPGTHNQVILHGTAGNRAAIGYIADRRSVETQARFRVFHGATNHPEVDFYFLEAGQTVTEGTLNSALEYPALTQSATVVAGSYDLFATTSDSATVIAGPYRLDLALGDAVEILLLDSVDPSAAQFATVPEP